MTIVLFLNDLGVLDHRDPAALGQLAFQRDTFAAVFGKLIVHRLMFANDEVCFALANNADRTTAFDTFGPAGLTMFLTHGVMIDVTHHIDDFAGDRFFSGRAQILFSVLVLLCNRQRRERQRCDESCDYCNFQDGRFIGWIKHDISVGGSMRWSIALPSLLDQIGELVEEVGGVMRAGRGFGVILHAKDRQFLVPHPLDGAVV
jgi:hypothetical protein